MGRNDLRVGRYAYSRKFPSPSLEVLSFHRGYRQLQALDCKGPGDLQGSVQPKGLEIL